MIDIPDPESASCVADCVELELFVSEKRLSKLELAYALNNSAGKEPTEYFIVNVWRELERRNKLYLQPLFQIHDRLIEYCDEVQPSKEYLACLLLSLYGGQENVQYNAKLFEKLTREALSNYISGKAIVFGWPFELEAVPGEEETTRLERNIRKIAEELHENFNIAPRTGYKDRGLDVIGWVPFPDSRSSQVVILVQSAVGRNWRIKSAVPISSWTQYILWARDPQIAFAVPHIIDEDIWHDESRGKGILFDRARIVYLLSKGIKDEDFKLELATWVENQLTELRG